MSLSPIIWNFMGVDRPWHAHMEVTFPTHKVGEVAVAESIGGPLWDFETLGLCIMFVLWRFGNFVNQIMLLPNGGLCWWLNQPVWKILQNGFSSPSRDEHQKKYLKPPPSGEFNGDFQPMGSNPKCLRAYQQTFGAYPTCHKWRFPS